MGAGTRGPLETMGCAVLVVEDDPELREMMVQMLVLEGFVAEAACDGVEALDKLRSAGIRPHVILLDMMMPRMDGWEFCRQQALDPALEHIPVVVLTAAPREHVEVGAAAVLSKPFDYDTLLHTVRAYC
jgi:CheY-like chemotaxis protein